MGLWSGARQSVWSENQVYLRLTKLNRSVEFQASLVWEHSVRRPRSLRDTPTPTPTPFRGRLMGPVFFLLSPWQRFTSMWGFLSAQCLRCATLMSQLQWDPRGWICVCVCVGGGDALVDRLHRRPYRFRIFLCRCCLTLTFPETPLVKEILGLHFMVSENWSQHKNTFFLFHF